MTNLLDRANQILGLADPSDADRAITAFDKETQGVDAWSLKLKDYAAAHAVLNSDPEAQVAVLIRLCERTVAEADYRFNHRMEKLASALFARPLPFTATAWNDCWRLADGKEGTGTTSAFNSWGASCVSRAASWTRGTH